MLHTYLIVKRLNWDNKRRWHWWDRDHVDFMHSIEAFHIPRLQLSSHEKIRYVGILRLLFLIGHRHLIGVWFSEDQRTNTIMIHVRKKTRQCHQIFIRYSTLNCEYSLKNLWIEFRNRQTCIFDNHNYIRDIFYPQSNTCWCFILDLLMQHKFCHVNLISRSWRTWKMD